VTCGVSIAHKRLTHRKETYQEDTAMNLTDIAARVTGERSWRSAPAVASTRHEMRSLGCLPVPSDTLLAAGPTTSMNWLSAEQEHMHHY
jgi:hypothetical protein